MMMDPKGRLSSEIHFLVPLGITYSDSLHCGNTLDQTYWCANLAFYMRLGFAYALIAIGIVMIILLTLSNVVICPSYTGNCVDEYLALWYVGMVILIVIGVISVRRTKKQRT